MYHVSDVTCHVSHVTCVMCSFSPITCHESQQPQLQTLSVLTPALCTGGWFAKTQKKKFKTPKQSETTKRQRTFGGMRILAICSSKCPIHWEKVVRNGTDRQTDRGTTYGDCDLETEAAEKADPGKIYKKKFCY